MPAKHELTENLLPVTGDRIDEGKVSKYPSPKEQPAVPPQLLSLQNPLKSSQK
jgi:hypothetical protein